MAALSSFKHSLNFALSTPARTRARFSASASRSSSSRFRSSTSFFTKDWACSAALRALSFSSFSRFAFSFSAAFFLASSFLSLAQRSETLASSAAFCLADRSGPVSEPGTLGSMLDGAGGEVGGETSFGASFSSATAAYGSAKM